MTGLEPDPWDAGAVAAILPELADACPDIDWSQPLAAWPRETMVEFLLAALRAHPQGRDRARPQREGITRQSSASTIARQANAAAGGPLMTPDELDDPYRTLAMPSTSTAPAFRSRP